MHGERALHGAGKAGQVVHGRMGKWLEQHKLDYDRPDRAAIWGWDFCAGPQWAGQQSRAAKPQLLFLRAISLLTSD